MYSAPAPTALFTGTIHTAKIIATPWTWKSRSIPEMNPPRRSRVWKKNVLPWLWGGVSVCLVMWHLAQLDPISYSCQRCFFSHLFKLIVIPTPPRLWVKRTGGLDIGGTPRSENGFQGPQIRAKGPNTNNPGLRGTRLFAKTVHGVDWTAYRKI